MSDTITKIASLSRTALFDLVVDQAANWIAEHDGDAVKEDIVVAIYRCFDTNGNEVFDRRYEGCGALVRALSTLDAASNAWIEQLSKATLLRIRSQLTRALEHLDPALAIEVERDGSARVYQERWEGRAGGD